MSVTYQIAGVERRPSGPNANPADGILRGGVHPAGNLTTHAVLLALVLWAEPFSIELRTALYRGLAGNLKPSARPVYGRLQKEALPALRVVTPDWCYERARQDQCQRERIGPIADPAKARNRRAAPVSRSASTDDALLALARLHGREAVRKTPCGSDFQNPPSHKESIR